MNQKYKGILLIITSALCFAGMNFFIRLSGDLPTMQKSFFRNLIALMLATAVILRRLPGPLASSVISTRWTICCSRMPPC